MSIFRDLLCSESFLCFRHCFLSHTSHLSFCIFTHRLYLFCDLISSLLSQCWNFDQNMWTLIIYPYTKSWIVNSFFNCLSSWLIPWFNLKCSVIHNRHMSQCINFHRSIISLYIKVINKPCSSSSHLQCCKFILQIR